MADDYAILVMLFLIGYVVQVVIHILGIITFILKGAIYVNEQVRFYEPFVGPFDPCPPIRLKSYVTPPHLFMNFSTAKFAAIPSTMRH